MNFSALPSFITTLMIFLGIILRITLSPCFFFHYLSFLFFYLFSVFRKADNVDAAYGDALLAAEYYRTGYPTQWDLFE